jgi:hypothetical protein
MCLIRIGILIRRPIDVIIAHIDDILDITIHLVALLILSTLERNRYLCALVHKSHNSHQNILAILDDQLSDGRASWWLGAGAIRL